MGLEEMIVDRKLHLEGSRKHYRVSHKQAVTTIPLLLILLVFPLIESDADTCYQA